MKTPSSEYETELIDNKLYLYYKLSITFEFAELDMLKENRRSLNGVTFLKASTQTVTLEGTWTATCGCDGTPILGFDGVKSTSATNIRWSAFSENNESNQQTFQKKWNGKDISWPWR